MIKTWYKSKTVWLALIQFIIGGLVAMNNLYPELAWILMLKSMLDITLRFLTYEEIV